MYNPELLTRKANTVINKAFLRAGKLGHTYVGSEHLLLALASETGSTSAVSCAPAVLPRKRYWEE